jgi:hypothetical protein
MACGLSEISKLSVWPACCSRFRPLLRNDVYTNHKTRRHARRPDKKRRNFKFEEMTRTESPHDILRLRTALDDRRRQKSGQEPQREPEVNMFYDL